MNLIETQQEVVDEFAMYGDWQQRYEQLIELGRELAPMPEEHKVEKNLVRGCQSQVWLVAREEQGKIHFIGDSDAMITKGLVALLIRVLDQRTPKEILDTPIDFIDRMGLHEHLSPHRSNGLASMIDQMKRYALALSSPTE